MATVKGDVHDIGKNIVGVVLGCNNYEVIDLGVMVSGGKDSAKSAREKKVDLIGLSGLITPSLDEMVHVAREMEREGFSVPLLIGGATTSRAHTAVKIAPAYRQPVVHVLDASRAVGVVSKLEQQGPARRLRATKIANEQERMREQYSGPRIAPLLSLEEARARQVAHRLGAIIGRRGRRSPAAASWDCVPLEKLVPLIDWTPFFHAWELKGIYPRIFEDAVVGPRAQGTL